MIRSSKETKAHLILFTYIGKLHKSKITEKYDLPVPNIYGVYNSKFAVMSVLIESVIPSSMLVYKGQLLTVLSVVSYILCIDVHKINMFALFYTHAFMQNVF